MKKRRSQAPLLISLTLVFLIGLLTTLYIAEIVKKGNGTFTPVGFAVLDNETTTNETITNQTATNTTETNQTTTENTCPGTLSQSKTLTVDINESAGGACITLLEPSITLDCNFHTIKAGDPAIQVQSNNNIIKNCFFETKNSAIKINSNNNLIKDSIIRLTENPETGLKLDNANNNALINITIKDVLSEEAVIDVTASNNNLIKSTTLDGIDWGILVQGNSENNIIDDARIINNKHSGIMFYNLAKSNNSIINSRITSNIATSIAIENENALDNWVINSAINEVTKNIVTTNNGNLSLLNVTIDTNKLNIADTNKIFLYKLANFKLINSSNSTLSNAKINVLHNNITEKTSWTDDNGKATLQVISKIFSTQTTIPNYDIQAVKLGISKLMALDLNSDEQTIILDIKYPKKTEFAAPQTTDLNAVTDLKNVSEFTLSSFKVKIAWENTVNVHEQDFDNAIEFTDDLVSINVTALDPTFNSSATMTFMNNITCPVVPVYIEAFTTNREQVISSGTICNATTDPNCTDIVCDDKNKRLVFKTSHFTSFTYKQPEAAQQAAPAPETPAPQETSQTAAQNTPQQAAPAPETPVNITATEIEQQTKLLYYIVPVIMIIIAAAGLLLMKKKDNADFEEKKDNNENKPKPPQLKIS